MTRINLVEPSQLTDKHLMAEYRELPRIFTAVKKRVEANTWDGFILSGEIPDKYVLGEGHVKFFYNKLRWLLSRYCNLHFELTSNRLFNLDKDKYYAVKCDAMHLICRLTKDMVDYSPTPEEVYLNMQRITDRHFNK